MTVIWARALPSDRLHQAAWPRLVRLRRIPSGSPGGSFDGKPWPRSATLSNDTWRTPPFADGRPRQWDNEEALGPSTRFKGIAGMRPRPRAVAGTPGGWSGTAALGMGVRYYTWSPEPSG